MRHILLSTAILLVAVAASAAPDKAGKVALVIDVESIASLGEDLDVMSRTLGVPAKPPALDKVFETQLRTTRFRGVDTNAAIRVYVFLPATQQDARIPPFIGSAAVWVLPINGDGSTYLKSVKARFETNFKAKGINHFSGTSTPGSFPASDFYVGIVKGKAVAGTHRANVEFLVGLLQKSSIKIAGMKNLRGTIRAAANIKTCLPSIEAGISQAGSALAQTPLSANPDAPRNPIQQMQSQAEALLGILKQVNSFAIGVGIHSGNIELSTSMIPKPGSNLAGIIESMELPSEDYMSFLPENSYLAAAGSGLNIMDEFIDPYCDMLKTLYAEMGPEMNEGGTRAINAMKAMKGIYSGDYAIGVLPSPDGTGANVVEIFAVTDAALARKQVEDTLATYNDVYGEMTPGMSVTVGKPRTYKGIEILTVKYSMPAQQVKGMPAMPSLFSNFDAEMGFTDKEVLYTIGKPEVMNAAIDRLKGPRGTRIDDTRAFKDAFPQVQGKPVKAVNLWLLRLIKAAIKAMPDVNAQQLEMIPDDASCICSYSYKNGSEVIGVIRIDLKEAVAVRDSLPLALGVLSQAALTGALQPRRQVDSGATRTLCIRNLRIIDAAKEQCALDRNLKDGATMEEAWLDKYLFGGRMPVCPEGKPYMINPVGQPPACSLPGHFLD